MLNHSNRSSVGHVAATILLAQLGASAAAAPAVDLPEGMTLLTDRIAAYGGMSNDGRIVAGSVDADGVSRAARWSFDTDAVVVLEDDLCGRAFVANDALIYGVVAVCDISGAETVSWDESGAMTPLPGFDPMIQWQLLAASSDDAVVVGTARGFGSSGGLPVQHAYRWTEQDGPTLLHGVPGPYNFASPWDTSDDGTVVVGWSLATLEGRAVMWLDGDPTPIELGPLDPDDPGGQATGVTADGGTIVGSSGEKAFRWSASAGISEIPGMASATAIAKDGSWILGGETDGRGVIWQPGIGTVPIAAWLAERGFEVPETFLSGLFSVVEISHDEQAILADGITADDEYFLLHYRLAHACPADFDRSGEVGFADLLALLGVWGVCTCPQDLDGNGTVGFTDLLALLGTWGSCS